MKPDERPRRPDPRRRRERRVQLARELSEIPPTPWWQRPDTDPDPEPPGDPAAIPENLPLAA